MKFAICQELFEDTSWEEQCRIISEAGYTGIEVAPFSITHDIASVSDYELLQLKATAETFGLEIIGLHWLLAKTEGLYLTSPDPQVRQATADYLKVLAKACNVMGGRVLVFGYPFQRNLLPGVSTQQAM